MGTAYTAAESGVPTYLGLTAGQLLCVEVVLALFALTVISVWFAVRLRRGRRPVVARRDPFLGTASTAQHLDALAG